MSNHSGRNGNRNRRRERPEQTGHTTGKRGGKDYVGRRCTGVLEVLLRGGSQYGLGLIISETDGTVE